MRKSMRWMSKIENILDFCKRQENITLEIENEILKKVEAVGKYFKE